MEPNFTIDAPYHCGSCEYLQRDAGMCYCTHQGALYLGDSRSRATIGPSDVIPPWCPLQLYRPRRPDLFDGPRPVSGKGIVPKGY